MKMVMVTVTEAATPSSNIADQGSHGNSNAKQQTSAWRQRHWGNSIRVQWQWHWQLRLTCSMTCNRKIYFYCSSNQPLATSTAQPLPQQQGWCNRMDAQWDFWVVTVLWVVMTAAGEIKRFKAAINRLLQQQQASICGNGDRFMLWMMGLVEK